MSAQIDRDSATTYGRMAEPELKYRARVVKDLRAMLSMAGEARGLAEDGAEGWDVPVLAVAASRGEGLEAVTAALVKELRDRTASGVAVSEPAACFVWTRRKSSSISAAEA